MSIDRLRKRADRIFRTLQPSEALQSVRAIVGPGGMPVVEEGKMADQALDALRNLQVPTPRQLAALEEMIRLLRPAPLVRKGRPDDFPDPLFEKQFPLWKQFQDGLAQYSASIGRVGFPDDREIGTGFLVAADLLVTNKHVLMKLSNSTMCLEKGQAVVWFEYEYGTPKGDPVPITGVKAIHDSLDAVLLTVEDGAVRKPLPVATADPVDGMALVVVGYPAEDGWNPLFMRAVFGGKYQVKRAAPGEVIDVRAPIFYHDSSTLGGNSGSPIFQMETAEVIGLHMSGAYLWRNEAVVGRALAPFVQLHSG